MQRSKSEDFAAAALEVKSPPVGQTVCRTSRLRPEAYLACCRKIFLSGTSLSEGHLAQSLRHAVSDLLGL